MNYNEFELLLKEHRTPSKEDMIFFSKFPLTQKSVLFLQACIYENLVAAKKISEKISDINPVVSDTLEKIICYHPQKTTDTLEWLMSFNVPYSLEKDYKHILSKQNPLVWDFVFSKYPFNENKMFLLTAYTVEKNLPEALDWIMNKHDSRCLPFSPYMYVWGFFQSFQQQKPTFGRKFMKKMVNFPAYELNPIKEMMLEKYTILPQFPSLFIPNHTSITGLPKSEIYSNYFNFFEKEALDRKLEQTLKTKPISKYTNRIKI